MAKIYSKSGEIVAIRINEEQELRDPVLDFDEELEFDPETNPDILSNYAQDHNGHSLVGSVLSQDGVTYTINPDSELTTDRKALLTLRDGLKGYHKLGSPTNAQSVAAIKGIIRVLGIILDWYLRRK